MPRPNFSPQAEGLWHVLWPIAAGGAVLLLFKLVGQQFYEGFLLDLGSASQPTALYANFLAFWSFFGTIAIAFLVLGFIRLASHNALGATVATCWNAWPATLWIASGSVAAFLIPLALQMYVLRGAPLTDDETGYRFMAELLATGRLRAESPPMKLFFDQVFMINDGHMYAQYFIGWPILMVPGVWLGMPGVMNPIYSSLTVPPLFLVLARVAAGGWAKLGILLFLSAPMLMVGAATGLSHTSCLCALAWMCWFFFRTQDPDSPWWSHAGLALFFGIAFFIRPGAALGIALPVLASWCARLCRAGVRRRAVKAGVFLVPAATLAFAFFAVNKIQNGSLYKVGYVRYHEYMRENEFRFSWVRGAATPESLSDVWASSPKKATANAGIALFRLDADLFGWPLSLLCALFAGTVPVARFFWMSFFVFFILHLPLADSGIDSFGPVHYFETAWPVLILSVIGLRRLSAEAWKVNARSPLLAGQAVPIQREYFIPALVLALMAAAVLGFLPVRLAGLARITANINMPLAAVRRADLHNAVVFAPQPFAPNCRSAPTQHFVSWRPANDPDLRNNVLWANHISVEQDRRLMDHFPGRKGYVMVWQSDCQVTLLPLDTLQPGSVPAGTIGGSGRGPS